MLYNSPLSLRTGTPVFFTLLACEYVVLWCLSGTRSEMDVNALRDRIQSTLDANADNRRQAELDLKYVRRDKSDVYLGF